jgi:tRNA(Ile)-lysidine synthase
VHPLAQRLLGHLRGQELLHAGERVGVAVSGGIDSVALLRLLLEVSGELGIVLSVVHFNHKLRGIESDADEQFVAALAREHGLEFYCDGDDVAGHAREQGVSLETAARKLRYGFFRHLIREGHDLQEVKAPTLSHNTGERRGTCGLDRILTGHTLDDQAETVLMRVIRGAGMRGLAGIHPRIPVDDDDGEVCGEIVRPLLEIRRRELQSYLKDIGQAWREDATNADAKFTRNRVRKLLVPLLEAEFNPSVTENLADLAKIARAEEDYWNNEIAGWMGTAVHWSEPEWARRVRVGSALVQIGSARPAAPSSNDAATDLASRIESASWSVMNASVDRLWFVGEPLAVQHRVIKAVGDEARIPLEFKHIEGIVAFAVEEGPAGKELSLPLGWKVRRESHEILFITPDMRDEAEPCDYEYDLPAHGQVHIHELGTSIELTSVAAGATGYNPDQLLDPDSLPGPLKVRNWRAGERFWPAHTKSPKKIKELLQERHVAQPIRRLWPVVVSGSELVWMRGFAVPERFRARPASEARAIVETMFERELP